MDEGINSMVDTIKELEAENERLKARLSLSKSLFAAGKLALAARLVTTANAKNLSQRVAEMEAALDAYDNEILSLNNDNNQLTAENLAETVINVMDKKGRAGCKNRTWIGFENGNGIEIGTDIENMINKAKQLVNNRSCPGYDLRNVASNPLTPNECIKTKGQDKDQALRDILDDFKRFSLSEDEAVERIEEVCYK